MLRAVEAAGTAFIIRVFALPNDEPAMKARSTANVAASGAALSQPAPKGGPTPSPAGAGVYFVDLKDGATIPTKPRSKYT